MGAQREHESAVPATVTQCLERERAGQRIGTRSAILLRDRQPLDADLRALPPQVAGKQLLAITVEQSIVQHFPRESQGSVIEQTLLLGQGKVHQASSFRR